MKIVGAEVEDPARTGFHNEPNLIVQVEGELEQTGEKEFYTLRDGETYMSVTHFGPFVRYSLYYTDERRNTGAYTGGGWSSRAGVYNTEIMPDKQVVDVTLKSPQGYRMAGYALELDRAEWAVRKFCKEWRLQLSARLAAYGEIVYVPCERMPSCLWKPSGQILGSDPICGKPATLPFMGRELGICDEHGVIRDEKALQARLRSGR